MSAITQVPCAVAARVGLRPPTTSAPAAAVGLDAEVVGEDALRHRLEPHVLAVGVEDRGAGLAGLALRGDEDELTRAPVDLEGRRREVRARGEVPVGIADGRRPAPAPRGPVTTTSSSASTAISPTMVMSSERISAGGADRPGRCRGRSAAAPRRARSARRSA